MTTTAKQFKITYTSSTADMGEFHRLFDEALAEVRAQCGRSHPLHIGGKPVSTKEAFKTTSPIDSTLVLGRFASAAPEHVDSAVRAAKKAQPGWARLPWKERVETLRRAAELIRERKFEIGATMSLEVGKSRMESMGDAEESADLIDYYCQQVVDASGFTREMARITPIERNIDILRPYGVFTCIAPFNFPMALSTGMSAAALVTGNSVVYKPAPETPWTGIKLYEIYRDAGVPAGVFNFVSGKDSVIGDPLWRHPLVDGVVFTGSRRVGMRIFRGFSRSWVKPCLMEMGGKNPAIVMDTADLDMAAEGVMRSAFGLQNQKCSATSRVYVHAKVAKEFTEKLLTRTRGVKIGDPTQRDVFFGPVINAKAVATWERAVAQAREEGQILCGGRRLTEGILAKGNFVAPTIARLPLTSSLYREELFSPFLALGEVDSLDQALSESNKAEYGLTAGFFSKRPAEIERFFDEIESGVTYVNKRTGATTGAWPGAQPFTGWKGSGSSGKGGCGPYYVAQFMREQSRTVVEEKKP